MQRISSHNIENMFGRTILRAEGKINRMELKKTLDIIYGGSSQLWRARRWNAMHSDSWIEWANPCGVFVFMFEMHSKPTTLALRENLNAFYFLFCSRLHRPSMLLLLLLLPFSTSPPLLPSLCVEWIVNVQNVHSQINCHYISFVMPLLLRVRVMWCYEVCNP